MGCPLFMCFWMSFSSLTNFVVSFSPAKIFPSLSSSSLHPSARSFIHSILQAVLCSWRCSTRCRFFLVLKKVCVVFICEKRLFRFRWCYGVSLQLLRVSECFKQLLGGYLLLQVNLSLYDIMFSRYIPSFILWLFFCPFYRPPEEKSLDLSLQYKQPQCRNV